MTKGQPIRNPSLPKFGVENTAKQHAFIYNTLSCKVAQNESGVSKGYGFVHFETELAKKRQTNLLIKL
ncbi:hypothetical protein E2986_12588 [Frieseomelitta varia]|uniref:Uncharacterized protein n=1 Tax=Frieseomelitta varia TaxID=561572 RepID=A0A833SLR4_9HYME|nr:hypothetical protein E2986_12588 [Frieseomelitta varia]